jgi:hypothetical protein
MENISERAKKDADTIDDILNNMSFKSEQVAKLLANMHPTLQQKFMRLCVEFIHEEATKEFFDDRNKATGKYAKMISELLKKENAYFPYI